METTRQKAGIACRLFDVRAIKKGMVSSEPVVDARYDRILDDGKNLIRVQIKYAGGQNSQASGASGAFLARLSIKYNGKITNRAYSKEEIDALVVYLPSKNCFCWFKPEHFEGKAVLSIRTEKSKNNQMSGVKWFEDFLW